MAMLEPKTSSEKAREIGERAYACSPPEGSRRRRQSEAGFGRTRSRLVEGQGLQPLPGEEHTLCSMVQSTDRRWHGVGREEDRGCRPENFICGLAGFNNHSTMRLRS